MMSHGPTLRTTPILLLAAALALALTGCRGGGREAPGPPAAAEPVAGAPAPALAQQSASFGVAVTLGAGQTALYPDGMHVRLERIDDSRCPPGATCVWQGELAPTLRLVGGQQADGQVLRLGTVRAVHGDAGKYVVALREATESTATIVVKAPDSASGPGDDPVRVTSPIQGQLVASPLTILGEARGSWYFEASFPVRLIDANGRVLAEGPAQAQGEWMTAQFVTFEATLEFADPGTTSGTLVLEKSNASGLPQHDDARTVPVQFRPNASANGCDRTGCSGEICSDREVASICIYRAEYACYRTAACERQVDGACGWTMTPELAGCLADSAEVTPE